jgi:hypothetical protein
MHWRRFATFLLGAWLAVLLFAAYIVAHNTRTGEALVGRSVPGLAERLKLLGPEQSRLLLNHHAAEQTRTFVPQLEVTEVVVGVLLTIVLLLATHANKLAAVLSTAMVALTLFLHYTIFPEIVYLGRQLDFAAESAMGGARYRMTALELTYGGLVLVKMLLGAALTGYLLIFKTRVRQVRRAPAGAVDDARYGSVHR